MRVLIQNRLKQFDGSLIFFSGKQVLDFIAGSIRRGILELEHMKMRRISQRVGDGVRTVVQYPSSSNSGIMETVSKRTYCFEPGK